MENRRGRRGNTAREGQGWSGQGTRQTGTRRESRHADNSRQDNGSTVGTRQTGERTRRATSSESGNEAAEEEEEGEDLMQRWMREMRKRRQQEGNARQRDTRQQHTSADRIANGERIREGSAGAEQTGTGTRRGGAEDGSTAVQGAGRRKEDGGERERGNPGGSARKLFSR